MPQILLPNKLHPSVRRPGRKPAGRVVIDWADPINTDLRAYYMGDGNPNRLMDLVSPEHPGAYNAASGSISNFAGRSQVSNTGGANNIIVANHDRLQITRAITICGWFYLTGSDAYPCLIFKNHNTSYSLALRWGAGGNMRTNLNVGGRRDYDWSTGGSPADNEWHFCATTFNGSTCRGWLDGVEATLSGASDYSGSIGTDTNNLQPGGDVINNSGGNYYIDNIRIYERALSFGELEKIRLDGFIGLKSINPMVYFPPESAPPVARRRFVITG